MADNLGFSTFTTPSPDLPGVYLWPNGSTSECSEIEAVPNDDCFKTALYLRKDSKNFQSLTCKITSYKLKIGTIHNLGTLHGSIPLILMSTILFLTHKLLDLWLIVRVFNLRFSPPGLIDVYLWPNGSTSE